MDLTCWSIPGHRQTIDLIDVAKTQTSLDRGQCQALIAALIREFAQIQGPPGTANSFLGVHLMIVLLDAVYQLSPIIVV
jgi:hypothetical protein